MGYKARYTHNSAQYESDDIQLDVSKPPYLTPAALKDWIPKLIYANKIYRFYNTPEWKRLRRQVLELNHYECEDCRAKSPARITRATTVHHDRTVEQHPELALAMVWVDKKGRVHQQLFALCEDCHNARHERFGHGATRETSERFGHGAAHKTSEPLTPERW